MLSGSPLTGTAPDAGTLACVVVIAVGSAVVGGILGWLRGYERGTLAERDARVQRACDRFDAVKLPPNVSPLASRPAVSYRLEGIATPATIDSLVRQVRPEDGE